MTPKVSIVVPIYNVEKYIHRCVDSIINQSYKNLEIILVNDGSLDNCGSISEEYAKKDNRIKVVHKENGGLSDARNFGMKKITGEYTFFLDSDDWITADIIENLVKVSIENNADVVQSGFYYAYEDYLLFDDRYYKENELVILDNKTLMKELVINDKIKNFAWGKLYKTTLVKEIPFKKGVLFEDVFWAHKVMQKVSTYAVFNKPMCYYLQRSDSISGNYNIKNLDIIDGLIERHEFIENNYKELKYYSYKRILKTCLMHYELLEKSSQVDKNKEHRQAIINYIENNYEEINKAISLDKQLKINLGIFKLNPSMVKLNRYVNWMLRITKIIPNERSLKRIDINERIKKFLTLTITHIFNLFPIKKNKIFLFSYYGSQYGCSPKYISEYIVKNYPKDKFDVVWAFNDISSKEHIEDIRKVRIMSLKYFYELSTSKIIITNFRTTNTFIKRKNQYYIQTWHSSLRLKQIEKDAENSLPKNYAEMAKEDSKKCDLLLSGCKYSTDIFKRAYWYNGEIFEHGTPRN
ncbi:MAG: bifunctional glycosyltransferase/CDP-glycerol:glycerophosphate glycerophosphotransferase, partial [Paraclostridium sp.]